MNETYSDYETVGTPPRTFSWLETWWLAMSRPTVAAYEALSRDPKASLGRTFIWMLLVSLFNLLVSLVATLFLSAPFAGYSAEMQESAEMLYGAVAGSLVGLVCCAPGTVVLSLVLFAVYAGVSYLTAKMLSGAGSYATQLYVTAAYTAPIGFLTTLAYRIPYVGWLFTFPIALYMLVLNAVSIKAVHKFSWWKAIVSVVMLYVVIFVVIIALVVLFTILLMLLGPQLEDIFRQLSQELNSLTLLR